MNEVIWKFPLRTDDRQIIEMPIDASILSVQMQGETMCLWAVVDPKANREKRLFEIVGTGNPMRNLMPENLARHHIDTVQMLDGKLVFHVFELL